MGANSSFFSRKASKVALRASMRVCRSGLSKRAYISPSEQSLPWKGIFTIAFFCWYWFTSSLSLAISSSPEESSLASRSRRGRYSGPNFFSSSGRKGLSSRAFV